jgi:DNA polymerase-1
MEVDIGALRQIKDRLEAGLAVQTERLVQWGVTFSKTAEIASVLKEAGWTTGRLTPITHQPSTDESALIETKRAYPESVPFVNTVLRARGAAKLLSTYVEPFIQSGGRIYPEYNQDTATGRLSSRNPNGQNLPGAIKRTIIAPPGHWLVTADASQLEMWMMGVLSGDPKMLEYLSKEDFHYEMAKELFDTATPTVGNPSQRYDAKTTNFAMAFGGGWQIIMEKTGRSKEWAQAMAAKYFTRFPMFMEWVQETQRLALATGVVYNYFGRPRRIHELGTSDKYMVGKGLRESINTPVQGSAVDGIKLMMIEFDPVLREHGGRYINQEHDAFTAEIPKREEEFIGKMPEMLTEILSSFFPGVRIPMKVKKGERWG